MEGVPYYYDIFVRCTADYYHSGSINERINQVPANPFEESTFEHLLCHKSQIDNVQWDLEDLIRDPHIIPADALQLKRRIDKSNQQRTDTVEKIDDIFFEQYKSVTPQKDARLNTESIAWALDRLSILALKIFHMSKQLDRKDTDDNHYNQCRDKLYILLKQQEDLARAITELIEDVGSGKRIIKVYRQMKMYNDPSLNPVLYTPKKPE